MAKRIGFGPVFAFECLTTSRRWQVYAGRALLVTGVLVGLTLVWLNRLDGRDLTDSQATRRGRLRVLPLDHGGRTRPGARRRPGGDGGGDLPGQDAGRADPDDGHRPVRRRDRARQVRLPPGDRPGRPRLRAPRPGDRLVPGRGRPGGRARRFDGDRRRGGPGGRRRHDLLGLGDQAARGARWRPTPRGRSGSWRPWRGARRSGDRVGDQGSRLPLPQQPVLVDLRVPRTRIRLDLRPPCPLSRRVPGGLGRARGGRDLADSPRDPPAGEPRRESDRPPEQQGRGTVAMGRDARGFPRPRPDPLAGVAPPPVLRLGADDLVALRRPVGGLLPAGDLRQPRHRPGRRARSWSRSGC